MLVKDLFERDLVVHALIYCFARGCTQIMMGERDISWKRISRIPFK